MSAENLRLKEAVASMREVMVKMSKVRTRLHGIIAPFELRTMFRLHNAFSQ